MDHGAAEGSLSTTKTTTNNTHENSRYTTLCTPTADGDRKSGGSQLVCLARRRRQRPDP